MEFGSVLYASFKLYSTMKGYTEECTTTKYTKYRVKCSCFMHNAAYVYRYRVVIN